MSLIARMHARHRGDNLSEIMNKNKDESVNREHRSVYYKSRPHDVHATAVQAAGRDKSDPFTYQRVRSHLENGVAGHDDYQQGKVL